MQAYAHWMPSSDSPKGRPLAVGPVDRRRCYAALPRARAGRKHLAVPASPSEKAPWVASFGYWAALGTMVPGTDSRTPSPWHGPLEHRSSGRRLKRSSWGPWKPLRIAILGWAQWTPCGKKYTDAKNGLPTTICFTCCSTLRSARAWVWTSAYARLRFLSSMVTFFSSTWKVSWSTYMPFRVALTLMTRAWSFPRVTLSSASSFSARAAAAFAAPPHAELYLAQP